MIIFPADHPLVLNGTYDQEGFTPKERRAFQRKCEHPKYSIEKMVCPTCGWTPNCGWGFAPKEADMAKRSKSAKVTKNTKKKSTPARRPRQVPLNGMEDVRIRSLDDCAASIAEIRDQMNDLRGQEADQLRRALTLMRKHERETWRAAGVELVRVPGEEKLRVRTSKEQATAEVEEEEQDEQVDQDAAEAEDGAAVTEDGAEA